MIGRTRLYVRLSVANLRRHRARWLLTTTGIALGLLAFTGVLALNRSIVASFEQSVLQAAGPAQLEITNGTAGVDASIVDAVRAIPGVRAAGGNVQYSVFIPAIGRRVTVLGVPLGTDRYREDQLGEDALELDDELTFIARSDSAAFTDAILAEHGWRNGSRVEVQGPRGRAVLTVRGILHPRGPLRAFGDDILFMDSDAAQVAFGELDKFHWIDVVVAASASVDAVRSELQRLVAGRATVETPLGRGRRMESMVGTLRLMLTLSSVVAMLVGALLIYHTVATAVRQRHGQLVTLRVLGARRRDIVVYLLSEAAAVGVVGSVVGVVGGLVFARLAVRRFGDVISSMYAPVSATAFAFTLGDAAVAVVLGVLTTVAGAAVPSVAALALRRGHDSTPCSTGRIVGLACGGFFSVVLGLFVVQGAALPGFASRVGSVASFAGLLFIGTTLVAPLAVRVAGSFVGPVLRSISGPLGSWLWAQIRNRPGHTAVTIGALAAGTAFALGMATLLGSYRAAFSTWIAQTFHADVFVNAGSRISLLGGPSLDFAVSRDIESVAGVRRVLPWRLVEVSFRGQPIIVQGMAESLIDRAHPGVRLDHAAGEVVISDTLAERYRIVLGETLAIAAPFGAVSVTVKAIEPDYVIDLGNVKIGWGLFSKYFGETGANVFLVEADGVPGRELERRIADRLGNRYDASLLTGEELHAMVGNLIEQSFALTYALELLAALVTVCAMIGSTSATIIDRADELVTLRALGMLRTRLIRLLMGEAAVIGAFGSGLGLVSGALLGGTFVKTVAPAVAGFRFTLRWPIGTMAGLVVASVVAAIGAAGAVARHWTRQPIAIDEPTALA